MHRAARLSLILVLLALPAVVAAGNANNLAPCPDVHRRRRLLAFLCLRRLLQHVRVLLGRSDEPGRLSVGHTRARDRILEEAHPCCWNRPCSTFETANDCAVGGGGSPPATARKPNCHWFPSMELGGGRCGCCPAPSRYPALPANQSQERFAPFDCDCPYLTQEEWRPRAARVRVGRRRSTTSRSTGRRPGKGGDKFVRFGSISSRRIPGERPLPGDEAGGLGLPANKNGEGVNDADTHREEYLVKPVRALRVRQARRSTS